MLANNIVKFENENTKIKEVIDGYFNELNRKNRDYVEKANTNRTADTYQTDIRQYFFLKGKPKKMELEYLSLNDLSITQDEFEEYVDKLFNMKDDKGNNVYVNKTINKKIAAMKSFIKYLKRKKVIDTDISYLELIKGEKEKQTHYGALEPDEVLKMAELALDERDKGNIKRLLILTAFKTGLRVSEITGLKWKDLLVKQDEVIITGVGKGNKDFEVKIPMEMYEELLTLNQGQEKIFNLSSRRITDMMDRMRTKMEIPEERNIVFHSIRKCFGTTVWRMTGDIEAARRALRHSDVKTTQIYLGAGNYEAIDSLTSLEKIQEDLYKNVSAEDLLQAIENCPKNIKLIINMKLQEVLKGEKRKTDELITKLIIYKKDQKD